MSLPSPTLSVPSLTADQISFQGLTMGGTGTPYGIKKLEGLEKPETRSGNMERPGARGAFIGMNLLKTRTVTATMDVGPPFGSYTNLAGAVSSLRTACATEGNTEYPLWIQLPGFPLVACMARVTKKNIPWDIVADLGNLVQAATIQFEATDPYFYSAPTQRPNVGLPTPGVGFSFPLTFNLSFGGGSTANQLTVTNAGDVPCWPTLVITGPCLNPSVQNLSIAGSPTITFNVQLNTGDQLVVDCDLQVVTYFSAGSTVGSPRLNVVNAGSTFFALLSGANVIAFNDQSTSQASGTLQVWNASTYDGLL